MHTTRAILHNRTLMILGISESVSGIGNWITMMAVFAMVVFRGHGNVLQSSAIFLAGLLPTLLFSPIAGWLCDRFDRKGLMIGSELLSGLTIAGLIFVTRLEWILAILAVQAISISIMSPARQAVIPSLVSQEDLTRANAFLQQLAGIIKIGAPMLAGLILTVMNPHQAIVLDLISFILSAFILSKLPSLPVQSESDIEGHGKIESSKAKILPALREQPLLQLLFLIAFLSITVLVGFDILAPVFIRDVLHQSEKYFGFAIGLIGLGTLAASILLLLRKENKDPWKDVVWGMLLLAGIPAAMGAVAYTQNPLLGSWLVVAVCLVGGVGNGLLIIQFGTLLQTLSPGRLLGRMGGIFQSTAVGGQMLGILLTPWLVPALVPMWAYFWFAALALVFLIFGTFIITHHQQAALRLEVKVE